MGEFMATSRTTGWIIATASLMLATGCAQAPGQAAPAAAPPTASQAATTAPSSSAPASAAAGEQGQAPGGLQINTMPLGGTSVDVEAKLPINGYWAAPGQEITYDASKSEGVIDKYEWDLDGDGTFDQTTTAPVLKHTYAQKFEGEMILRVSNPLGGTNVLKTPVHIGSAGPNGIPLAPPTNVKAEVLSADGTEVKVTWESNDPRADSWAVAVDGFPVGRIEKSARSVTVTDIRRTKDVRLEIFAITADGAVGERAATTLPAAR
jgi:hypothetical protein